MSAFMLYVLCVLCMLHAAASTWHTHPCVQDAWVQGVARRGVCDAASCTAFYSIRLVRLQQHKSTRSHAHAYASTART